MTDQFRIHISNRALSFLEGYRQIGYSYEDSDLGSLDEADEFFAQIDAAAPGAFVYITTGDYLIPSRCLSETFNCTQRLPFGGVDRYHECETYDPIYCRIIISRALWDEQKDRVLREDFLWRTERTHCLDVLRHMDYWWWLDTNDYPRESEVQS